MPIPLQLIILQDFRMEGLNVQQIQQNRANYNYRVSQKNVPFMVNRIFGQRSCNLIDGMWKVHISSGILGVFAPMGQQEIVLKRDLHLASDEPWVKIG